MNDNIPIFADMECPKCGALCGNNGSGKVFSCPSCGWRGEIPMDPQDMRLIQDIVAKHRQRNQ